MKEVDRVASCIFNHHFELQISSDKCISTSRIFAQRLGLQAMVIIPARETILDHEGQCC